jgi:hypothetical protein
VRRERTWLDKSWNVASIHSHSIAIPIPDPEPELRSSSCRACHALARSSRLYDSVRWAAALCTTSRAWSQHGSAWLNDNNTSLCASVPVSDVCPCARDAYCSPPPPPPPSYVCMYLSLSCSCHRVSTHLGRRSSPYHFCLLSLLSLLRSLAVRVNRCCCSS